MRMEKKSYKATDVLLCTCPYQPLLAAGCECELCMGIIAELETPEWDNMPSREQYDMSYFEALERLFEELEFAA